MSTGWNLSAPVDVCSLSAAVADGGLAVAARGAMHASGRGLSGASALRGRLSAAVASWFQDGLILYRGCFASVPDIESRTVLLFESSSGL